jgi:hypothetical protein
MLYHAQSQQQVSTLITMFHTLILMAHQSVNEFILRLGLKEVNADKCCKISALDLSEEEWTHV